MEDKMIVQLYFDRNEQAIRETEAKYGKYCYKISYGILKDGEDAKEVVNDTYVGAWNAMPPHQPEMLSTFLGKITRRLSLKRWRDQSAKKRGSGETQIAFSELEECIAADKTIDEALEIQELTQIINRFLESLPVQERRVFLRRYWFADAINKIAEDFGYSESKVKSMLKRIRDKLRKVLEREEIWV